MRNLDNESWVNVAGDCTDIMLERGLNGKCRIPEGVEQESTQRGKEELFVIFVFFGAFSRQTRKGAEAF
jgi:hypothetical protein